MSSSATCHFPSTVKLKDVLAVINISLGGVLKNFSIEKEYVGQPKGEGWDDFYASRVESINKVQRQNKIKDGNNDELWPLSHNSFLKTTYNVGANDSMFSFFYMLASDEGLLSTSRSLYMSLSTTPIYQAMALRLVNVFGGKFLANDCYEGCLPYEVGLKDSEFPQKKNFQTIFEYEQEKKVWLDSLLPLDFSIMCHFGGFNSPYPLSEEYKKMEPFLSDIFTVKETFKLPDEAVINELRKFEDEKLLLKEIKKSPSFLKPSRF